MDSEVFCQTLSWSAIIDVSSKSKLEMDVENFICLHPSILPSAGTKTFKVQYDLVVVRALECSDPLQSVGLCRAAFTGNAQLL